jgi:hypothetical protein
VYRSYFSNNKNTRLQVWRVVLGWDLVPRLPDFFYHGGHTIQISESSSSSSSSQQDDDDDDNEQIRNVTAYYEHYGNESLGYAGVPVGWSSKPYIWVPGALQAHHIAKYLNVLQNWNTTSTPWVSDFARLQPRKNDTDDDDSGNDDAYVNPPCDDFPISKQD